MYTWDMFLHLKTTHQHIEAGKSCGSYLMNYTPENQHGTWKKDPWKHEQTHRTKLNLHLVLSSTWFFSNGCFMIQKNPVAGFKPMASHASWHPTPIVPWGASCLQDLSRRWCRGALARAWKLHGKSHQAYVGSTWQIAKHVWEPWTNTKTRNK